MIGRTAAKLLLKRLEQGPNRRSYQQIILPAALIRRNSVAPLK